MIESKHSNSKNRLELAKSAHSETIRAYEAACDCVRTAEQVKHRCNLAVLAASELAMLCCK